LAEAGESVSGTFDDRYQLSRIQAGTVADFQYVRDAAGNITSSSGFQIPSITTADAGDTGYSYTGVSINGVLAGEYAYDAFGRRTKKVASGITTLYHYDSSGKLIAETDENGNVQRDYIYLNGEPAALKLYGTQAGMYFFINDHLGTPQKIVNKAICLIVSILPDTATARPSLPFRFFYRGSHQS
jgi:YD repeat-containing protein